MSVDRPVRGRLLQVAVVAAGGRPSARDRMLARALRADGWQVSRLVLAAGSSGIHLRREGPAAGWTDDPDQEVQVVLPAAVEDDDLRGWSSDRLDDPEGWRERYPGDGHGRSQPHWRTPAGAAVAEAIRHVAPLVCIVSTEVWDIAQAVAEAGAARGVPVLHDVLDPRPPGLLRGRGAASPALEAELSTVEQAVGLWIPAGADAELWRAAHPAARITVRPAWAQPIEPHEWRTGWLHACGGASFTAPIPELVDAVYAAPRRPPMVWTGAPARDRSHRRMLTLLAQQQSEVATDRPARLVAALAAGEELPAEAVAAWVTGLACIAVARADHPLAVALDGVDGWTVATPDHDSIAAALATAGDTGASDPTPQADRADAVREAWRLLVQDVVEVSR